ncbi:MAG TPA: glycosyltransferase [Solirubrobacterales bacterium]|nr:glycosyltransferase [Solirubrobacterales bacterium]
MSLPARSVWIDVQGCQNTANFERGIARQAAESTEGLLRVAPEVIHTVGLTPLLPVPSSLDFLHGTGLLGWVSGRGSEPDPRPSIYHVTSPFEGPSPTVTLEEQWPHWARRAGVRLVITLHDLIPLLFPEHYIDPDPLISSPWLARLGIVRAADHILAVSQSSAADAVEHLEFDENRITVIDAGTSTQIAAMVGSREEAAKIVRRRLPSLRDGFLFYVGGADWRKNVKGLIEAYGRLPDRLRDRHQLVITYKLDRRGRDALEDFAKRQGIRPGQLLLTGFVPDRELSALYRLCALFVFPSLYEGAGLPILEAMACGAPVVGSNVSSVPEILGDLRAAFDPADPCDIAACLERTLQSEAELERLRRVSADRAAHFTWDRVAGKAIEGYERALSAPGHRDTRPRRTKRLAVFTPWPPDASPSAAYSRQLVERLADHAEVDVIVAGSASNDAYDRSLEPRVRLWAAGDFDWAHELRDFDRILYVLGDSPIHLHAIEGLISRPGTVIAHDVRFGRLYESMKPEFWENPVWMREKLYGMYGDRIPAGDLRRSPDDPEVQARFGIYMSQEVQSHAERILVHSRCAADVLRMDRLPGDPGAETVVVGRGIPERALGRNGERPAGELRVISHGAGERPEAIDLLLHGFAALAKERPEARLVLLGHLEEAAERRLHETASNLRIGDAIEMRGHLDGADYWRALAESDVAVQLRTSSDGEVSGSVCDCLAARVPTIVSAVGWLRELPSPAVLHVPRDCAPSALAVQIEEVVEDPGLRKRIRAAQDEYAEANSYERVAERYAELLGL